MAFDVLALAAVSWYCLIWSIGLLGWHLARTRYTNPPDAPPLLDRKNAPGVTILRPLCGLDDNLYENLELSFKQDYPLFELILCVADERDQAISIARTLLDRYKDVDARLIIGETAVGANPKINNLSRGYKEARYDIVWVLDSNVLTRSDTLSRSVVALQQPGVGLVHHIPFALYPGLGLGGRLDQAFLNTTHAKMYLAINRLAVDSCLMGKSNLYRRSDLARSIPLYRPLIRAGLADKVGLDTFGCYLGEDNVIGLTLWHGGKLKHVMTSDVAGNTVGGMSVRAYFWRRVRWIRIRKYMVTAATLLEPWTESVVVGLMGCFALKRLLGLPPWIVFLLHEVAWYSIDTSVFQSIAASSPAFPPTRAVHELPRGLDFLKPWLVREMLALPIWFVAMLGGSTLAWRGHDHRYRLHLNGTVSVEHIASQAALAR